MKLDGARLRTYQCNSYWYPLYNDSSVRKLPQASLAYQQRRVYSALHPKYRLQALEDIGEVEGHFLWLPAASSSW